jgi:hypothetical protein
MKENLTMSRRKFDLYIVCLSVLLSVCLLGLFFCPWTRAIAATAGIDLLCIVALFYAKSSALSLEGEPKEKLIPGVRYVIASPSELREGEVSDHILVFLGHYERLGAEGINILAYSFDADDFLELLGLDVGDSFVADTDGHMEDVRIGIEEPSSRV